MDNQHRLIKGYKDFDQKTLDTINEIKLMGKDIGEFCEKLKETDVDQRWLAIGITDLQRGLMALTRAVAKPDFF